MAIEDALVERKVVEQTESAVVIHETWDTTHPDCPFAWFPASFAPPARYTQWVELTPEEYKQKFPEAT
jgi:hypothetical protein